MGGDIKAAAPGLHQTKKFYMEPAQGGYTGPHCPMVSYPTLKSKQIKIAFTNFLRLLRL